MTQVQKGLDALEEASLSKARTVSAIPPSLLSATATLPALPCLVLLQQDPVSLSSVLASATGVAVDRGFRRNTARG